MTNPIVRFFLLLTGVLLLIGLVHTSTLRILGFPVFENLLVRAYLVNYMLAIVVYLILFLSRKKYMSSLGFIFMAGSLLKFLVFFILFYPDYRADGQISSLETTGFLTPYLVCLFLETFTLVRLLNRNG
jgi:hypothetical protein